MSQFIFALIRCGAVMICLGAFSVSLLYGAEPTADREAECKPDSNQMFDCSSYEFSSHPDTDSKLRFRIKADRMRYGFARCVEAWFETNLGKDHCSKPDCKKKTVVELRSDGGNTKEGLILARWFHEKGISTVIKKGDRCGSACALAFLGGSEPAINQNDNSVNPLSVKRRPSRTLIAGGKLDLHTPGYDEYKDIEYLESVLRKCTCEAKTRSDCAIAIYEAVKLRFPRGLDDALDILELGDLVKVPSTFMRRFIPEPGKHRVDYPVNTVGRARYAGVDIMWPSNGDIPDTLKRITPHDLVRRSCSSVFIYDYFLRKILSFSDGRQYQDWFQNTAELKKQYLKIRDEAQVSLKDGDYVGSFQISINDGREFNLECKVKISPYNHSSEVALNAEDNTYPATLSVSYSGTNISTSVPISLALTACPFAEITKLQADKESCAPDGR